MSEEILINVTPRETRVGILENGVLQEFHLERTSCKGIVGNIYMGKVARVLPGMQAAFVEMGLEKAAFLHLSDMMEGGLSEAPVTNGGENISHLLREGQHIAVQVTKDPIGSKGARLTTRLSFASRYLVYIPDFDKVVASQRIEDEDEKARLIELLSEPSQTAKGGFIIRTAAEGINQQDLICNRIYLEKYWHLLKPKLQHAKPGEVLHRDLPLGLRTLRDLIHQSTERIRIDDKEAYENALDFSKEFAPNLENKLEYYRKERPIFELYGIEDELQKALQRKVNLKSGGTLIIDQTEAMTTIDVNTGGFVGHRNLEETIFKTNLEASVSIARQLRLRNLGGIIIIDFIDMTDEEHKRLVLRALEKALARDQAKVSISEVSNLGLVEMTRKRSSESLEHLLCELCPVCEGRGTLKTAQTVCNEIFRELLRAHQAFDAKAYLVLASQEVVDKMLEEESLNLGQLENLLGKSVKFQVESLYTQEQFDVVLM